MKKSSIIALFVLTTLATNTACAFFGYRPTVSGTQPTQIVLTADSLKLTEMPIPSETQIPSDTFTATSIPSAFSCGLGVIDLDVKIWVVGLEAKSVCGKVTAMIRQQGSQPITWNGQLTQFENNYQPVCSDVLPTVRYEIVDINLHIYGTAWCEWITQTLGASGSVTNPDLFGIVITFQQTGTAQQMSVQQTQNVRRIIAQKTAQEEQIIAQETETAQQQSIKATQDAKIQIYLTACKKHNGYIDNGYCVVDYPGWSSQRVTIKDDGTWDAYQANINLEDCKTASVDATTAANEGHPWANPPQYHEDTGVCIQGNP